MRGCSLIDYRAGRAASIQSGRPYPRPRTAESLTRDQIAHTVLGALPFLPVWRAREYTQRASPRFRRGVFYPRKGQQLGDLNRPSESDG